jgi:hypothetical protein
MRSASQRTGPRSPISPKPALVVHLRGAMGLARSLPREAADRRTSDDPLPSTSSATLTPKYLDNDDEERSGGSSLDDEFLSYLSGNTPPPVPPPPSVVAMVPASARKETNRASIEASMMRATAGPGNASWRAMLEAQAQALLDTAEAAAEADIAEAGARRRPPPRGDGLVRSLPREAADRRT